MGLRDIIRAALEELTEELSPLQDALNDDGLDEYSDVLQAVLDRITTLNAVLDNADLNDRIYSS